ncbi:unnamed protein product [Candida verbasci]|uniref:Family 17 glucosidase SCW4 n=1 Tax=Candida verbasci TaxID=1227364 RepID=A0A9W4XM81_9ASCO|nr:unnamed protein product [Candida verbasci]
MLFKSLVTFTLLAQSLAAPAVHQHHQHEKRAVHVVTKTNVVVVTVGAHTTTFPEVSLATPDSSISVSTVSDAPQVAPSGGASTTETDVPSSTESQSSSSSSSVVGSGGARGVTYSPYSDQGGCKSAGQIQSEVAALSGFDLIRLYGVDCDQVAQVLKAKTPSQKLFAGIFDVANIASGIETLASAVKENGSWDDIDTVSIGNELVNSGQCTPGQIQGYINTARPLLKAAGFSGSVVSVDTFIATINNPELCKYSDYVAVNAHAFFDGYYTAQDAGDWVLQQIQRVWTACGGEKQVLITETGWPSRGDSNGKAVPSKQNQQDAIASIKAKCGSAAILFTAFNDLWKADGPYNAEKYWGFLSN